MLRHPVADALAGAHPMLDIIGFGQRRAVGSQRLLISAPMELLGVGEKSVQIKNDRCDHRLKPIIFVSSSRPFDSRPGLGQGLSLRVSPTGVMGGATTLPLGLHADRFCTPIIDCCSSGSYSDANSTEVRSCR